MKTNELDTREATCKWWAAQDARMRNIANASHFSEADKIKAERMKFALELVYSFKGIHVNFRKKKIAIKVDGASVKNRRDLQLLEKDWESTGVSKSVTAQGVIYSFG